MRESAIRPLNGGEPDQSPQGSAGLAGGQQCGRALRQIARPDQVIASQIAVALGLAPRDAHGRHQRALKCFVLVGEQDAAAQPVGMPAIGGVLAEIVFRIDDRALPLTAIGMAMSLERHRQRL